MGFRWHAVYYRKHEGREPIYRVVKRVFRLTFMCISGTILFDKSKKTSMKRLLVSIVIASLYFSLSYGQAQEGFFDFEYDDASGEMLLHISEDQLDQEFLYVNSLSAGIGSNDIGLDRGQLGEERIVKLKRAGDKILMIQPNLDYRAVSDNILERQAVEQAFAQSVIWGFKVKDNKNGLLRVDMTDFLLRDAHGVSQRLKQSGQGAYKVDKSRSAVWMDRTKSFPQNTEFDAILTFTGQADGRFIRSVTPSSDAITVHQHHSFVALPDDGYEPRTFHPFAGYFPMSYYDYATPIADDLEKRFIYRHRLEKKNPSAAVSEAVEPIIYYIDPGCPEPIKSALMDGAAWWDQAFSAAGYAPGTFQIKELPDGADMMDVRYNVIQWVHRSTRGWSYGASVSDPRTGEIIKGHVSLGSLRVRQDFLIAQGLLSPYGDSDDNDDPMLQLALARLRQLSAHEIGHTIGLAHNFAASHNDRASVMDYPHPLVSLDDSGQITFDNVYDDKIGDWDKFTITYGYQDFPDGTDEVASLNKLVTETQEKGFLFISDSDARPAGGANPSAHLWDNGADPIAELNRLMEVRRIALDQMGLNTITSGTPVSELEKVLVPIYLLHRYQVDGVSKIIGGLEYNYAVKDGATSSHVTTISAERQGKAVDALLNTIRPKHLKLSQELLSLLGPPAYGYPRSRETFNGKTNVAFDPLAPAESHIDMTLGFLLHKDRLARIHRYGVTKMSVVDLESFLSMISGDIFGMKSLDSYDQSLIQLAQKIYQTHLIGLAHDSSVDINVAAAAHNAIAEIQSKYLSNTDSAHAKYLVSLIDQANTHGAELQLPQLSDLPPGSPIGCGHDNRLNR